MTKIGSWYDCINPLGKPPHAHYFETGETININYANKICPMCWHWIQPQNVQASKNADSWVEKKYPKRNDRADILPSKDYE